MRKLWSMMVVLLLSTTAGCLDALAPPARGAPRADSTSACDGHSPGEAHEDDGEVVPPLQEPLSVAAARIRVFTNTRHLDTLAEVVGVLDLHTSADSEDKGFDLLRWRAAQLGADAVIDAEFEHGHDGHPSHLSGMAVRFIP